jgi:hypothetical protein
MLNRISNKQTFANNTLRILAGGVVRVDWTRRPLKKRRRNEKTVIEDYACIGAMRRRCQ